MRFARRSCLLTALLCASPMLAAHARDDLPPLLAAARSADHDAAMALVRDRVDVGAVEADGTSALHWAAHFGDAELVRALLAAGADANAVLPEGETVLMTAARTGSAEALRALLAHGAGTEARDRFHGESALIWAAAENHADAVRVLAEHGADVDVIAHERHGRLVICAARRREQRGQVVARVCRQHRPCT